MGRRILAGIVGLLAGALTVYVVEMLGHRIWPLPGDVATMSKEQLATLVGGFPTAAKIFVVFGWAAGAFVGGLVAALIGRTRGPAIVVGVLLLLATASTFFYLPHPAWMMVLGVLLPVPAALAGARLAGARVAGKRAAPPG